MLANIHMKFMLSPEGLPKCKTCAQHICTLIKALIFIAVNLPHIHLTRKKNHIDISINNKSNTMAINNKNT